MTDLDLNSVIGILIFLVDLWAIYHTWISREETVTKVIWTVVILLLPVVGLLIWMFFGPKRAT